MVRLVESGGAHLKAAASSGTRGGMAEGGNLSDTTQSGHSPRAADVADGALAPTAGAEKSRGRPQSQGQFWLGRRVAVRDSWSEGSASEGSDTLDTATALATHAEPGGRGCKGSTLAVRSLPALWFPVGSSTRPEEAWPRPSLISMVNVVFILPPGSPVWMPTGSGVLGSSEQGLGPPALFSRDLGAKPRPPGPSS